MPYEAAAELLVAILEHLIVRLGVEAVHRDTGDLVEKVLRLHLAEVPART